MDIEGAVLLLTVMDHDTFGRDDFAGMCVVSCRDIPRLGSVTEHHAIMDPNAPQRKVLRLSLFHPANAVTSPVVPAELQSRAAISDPKAKDITKIVLSLK